MPYLYLKRFSNQRLQLDFLLCFEYSYQESKIKDNIGSFTIGFFDLAKMSITDESHSVAASAAHSRYDFTTGLRLWL